MRYASPTFVLRLTITMKILSALLVLAISIAPTMLFAGEFYSDTSPKIAAASNEILIKHGVCTNENDCTKKEVLFFHGTLSQVDFDYYGITDAETIAELISVNVNERARNHEKAPFTVSFHRESYRNSTDWLPFFSDAFIQIKFAGER